MCFFIYERLFWLKNIASALVLTLPYSLYIIFQLWILRHLPRRIARYRLCQVSASRAWLPGDLAHCRVGDRSFDEALQHLPPFHLGWHCDPHHRSGFTDPGPQAHLLGHLCDCGSGRGWRCCGYGQRGSDCGHHRLGGQG